MEVIPIMDRVVAEEYTRKYGEDQRKIQVRTFNLPESSKMRELNPRNIGQLLNLKGSQIIFFILCQFFVFCIILLGMVIRCSSLIPELKQAFSRCVICSYRLEVRIDRGRIHEPIGCPECGKKNGMQIIHNRFSSISLFSFPLIKQYVY
jgi:DNA replication licensing factor MCM4